MTSLSEPDSRTGWSSILVVGCLLAVAMGLGVLGIVNPSLKGGEPDRDLSSASEVDVPDLPSIVHDVRIQAILEGYGHLIDSVAYLEDDVVFHLPGGPVFFQGGRMLGEKSLLQAEEFDPLFYAYPLSPLRTPLPAAGEPRYSRDFLETLFGDTEKEIRSHGVSLDFLGRKVFVNAFLVEALETVEREIRAQAEKEPRVEAWVENIEIAYSFIDKDIAGTRGRSHHAFGMAIDLVPSSYGGKQVYWRWSRVFNRQDWDRIPLPDRWSPPQAVIQAFEDHGFVWGGKWPRFDTIHFEYRPEILAYNRMMREALP